MSQSYQSIVSLITKPSSERRDDEIVALLPWFSKKSRKFDTLETASLADILRNCGYASYEADKFIIRQHERGETFYIILSGKVSIYVNTDSVPDDPADARPVESAPSAPGALIDRKKVGNFISQLGAGKTFGELALIIKDCKRNASVITDEPTDLIVINRELFDRSVRAQQEYDLRMRETFVKEHPLFRGWAPRYRRQAMMSLHREQLQFGMVIVKQGDPVDGIVMIRSGQAKVMVDTIMHDRQYPNFTASENARPSSRLFNNGVLTSRQNYAQAECRLQKRNVELCIIGENEVIGDIEQCIGLPTYLQTVVCIQTCELMIFDEKNFERLIAKRNAQVNRMLQQNTEAKLRYREDSSVPLIRTLIQHIEHQKTIRRLKEAGADFRDPIEIVRQPISFSVKQLNDVQNFIPPRGAIIDLYGPGTLFYRNRTLRKFRQIEENRFQTRLKLNGDLPSVDHIRSQFTTKSAPQKMNDVLDASTSAAHHDGRHGNACVICSALNRSLRAESCRSGTSNATSRASTGRTFKDWETSNEHLSELERRMQEWLMLQTERNQQRQRFNTQIQLPNVTQLKTEMVSVPVRISANNLPVKLQRFKPVSRRAVQPGIKVVLRRRSEEHISVRSKTAMPVTRASIAQNLHARSQTDMTGSQSSSSRWNESVVRWHSGRALAISSAQLDQNSDTESVTSLGPTDRQGGSKKRSAKNKTVSVSEYKELKDRMKRQEVELANFRARVDIVY